MPSSKKSETSPKKFSDSPNAFPEEFFNRCLSSGRLSHAYLLLGADISATAAFCIRLVRRLYCRSGCPPDEARCAVCRRVENGNHPDLHRLQPEEDGGSVKIELTREIRRMVNMARFEAPCKVVLIEHAERMTEAAQNQVLKTLEEPPGGTLMLLLSTTTTGLLPTVVSRCVPVRFAPLSEEQIRSRLESGKPGETDADWAARAAAGSTERARLLLERQAGRLNSQILETLGRRDASHWTEFSETLLNFGTQTGSPARERRRQLREKLDILALILRDALLVSLDIVDRRLYNADNSSDIDRICEMFSTEEILDALAFIAQSHKLIEKSVNPELICDCIAQRLILGATERIQ